MNKEYKTKWINALRSGEYKQGKGQLRYSINGLELFCCLGVLCDIVIKENPDIGKWGFEDKSKVTDKVDAHLEIDGESYGGYLPFKICDITGVSTKGEFNENRPTLASYNDIQGYGFNEIADLIERNF